LFVPEELSFGPINENEGVDDTDDLDEFIETLVQHMSAPVEDRPSAAGLVPLVVRGAAEFLLRASGTPRPTSTARPVRTGAS
jgi:hypothetical protein